MYKIVTVLVATLLIFSCKTKPAAVAEVESRKIITLPDSIKRTSLPSGKENPRVTRTLIIYYDPEIGDNVLLKAVEDYGAELTYQYKALKGIAMRIPDGKTMENAMVYFRKVKGVTSVHRDQIHSIDPPIRSINFNKNPGQ